MREAIDKLIDRVKSPRFPDNRYYEAINQASTIILDNRLESIKNKVDYSFQSSERLRVELASLVMPTFSAVVTPGSSYISYHPDFYYLLSMENTVNGTKGPCRALTYNEKTVINRNPFKKPSSEETYYTEDSGGWKISLPANATWTACEYSFIKKPVLVSIGNENDKLYSYNTLIYGFSYVVYNETVYAGVTYYEGSSFNAQPPFNAITSGAVIIFFKLTHSDMPEHLQDEVVRLSAAIMEGTVENYNKQKTLIDFNQIS